MSELATIARSNDPSVPPLVRDPSLTPPRRVGWRLSRSTVVTLLFQAAFLYALWLLIDWGALRAATGTTPEACSGATGACWAVLQARWRLILFGLYPYDEQWRSACSGVIAVVTVALACLPAMWTPARMLAIWVCGYGLFIVLMRGGIPGLEYIPTDRWGGLSLTLFIYLTVILFGFPVGVGIALLRTDGLPAFRWLASVAVEVTRSVPLLTILFAAATILPLVLPTALQGDKLMRTLVGFVFFFGCYQSEIVRGGLAIVPRGQGEAAAALGLSYVTRTLFVVLPQALRTATPATINQFVVTFKETSLVVIVGVFDLMASGNAAYQTGAWSAYYAEVYLFIGVIYFVGAMSLSKYGAFVERRLMRASR